MAEGPHWEVEEVLREEVEDLKVLEEPGASIQIPRTVYSQKSPVS